MSTLRNLLGKVVLATLLPALVWPQDAEELFRQGGRFFAKRNLDAAIAAFQRSVELRPGYAPAWKALGAVYASRGEFERAETPFRNACERQPSLPDACLYYGRTLYLLNRFQPAINVLRRTIQKERENGEAYRRLGLSLEALGQAAEAGDALRQAVRLNRGSAPNEDPGIDYAVFLFRQGRAEDVMCPLESALKRLRTPPGRTWNWAASSSPWTTWRKLRRTWNEPWRSTRDARAPTFRSATSTCARASRKPPRSACVRAPSPSSSEQVQKPVAIVVEPAGRDRPGLVVNPRLARHLFESPITAIAIQRIMIHPGDEQIGVAIVIVVRGGRAHAVPLAAQIRFGRDIFEHAAPAIAVEPVPPTGIGLDQARLARAVSEKEVQQPIAVVIQSGDPSQHGFDLMLGGRGAVVQHHIEPRTRACVFKPSGERGRGGLDHAGQR